MEFLVFIEMENPLVQSRRLICKNARSAVVFLLSQHTVLIGHFDIHNNLVVLYFSRKVDLIFFYCGKKTHEIYPLNKNLNEIKFLGN